MLFNSQGLPQYYFIQYLEINLEYWILTHELNERLRIEDRQQLIAAMCAHLKRFILFFLWTISKECLSIDCRFICCVEPIFYFKTTKRLLLKKQASTELIHLTSAE